MPKTWKKRLIIKISKGDLTECGNWRGITLTSVPSKVFGRVLIDRIRDGVNSKLREMNKQVSEVGETDMG